MIEDSEKNFGSFLRFLEGESKSHDSGRLSGSEQVPRTWQQLEEWSYTHYDPWLRNLAERAFVHHDQNALNQLRLEYAWKLQRDE